jgi:hypothetical protein
MFTRPRKNQITNKYLTTQHMEFLDDTRMNSNICNLLTDAKIYHQSSITVLEHFQDVVTTLA